MERNSIPLNEAVKAVKNGGTVLGVFVLQGDTTVETLAAADFFYALDFDLDEDDELTEEEEEEIEELLEEDEDDDAPEEEDEPEEEEAEELVEEDDDMEEEEKKPAPKDTPGLHQKICNLYRQGRTIKYISQEVGRSVGTVHYHLRKEGLV